MVHADEIVVELPASVTIANICEVREDLAARLSAGGALVLDLDAVSDADLTFVQLIEAARRKTAEVGRVLRLRHPATGAVLEVLRRGGFLDDGASERARFWLEGAAQ